MGWAWAVEWGGVEWGWGRNLGTRGRVWRLGVVSKRAEGGTGGGGRGVRGRDKELGVVLEAAGTGRMDRGGVLERPEIWTCQNDGPVGSKRPTPRHSKVKTLPSTCA